MSGELEAAGALATAGAVAGVIEGREGGAAGDGPCLNCGTALAGGRYCSNCGQAAQPHRTLHGMVGEFLSGLWNFDTKAWRTLPRLLLRPGTLTREYVYGKRARYVSPLATFLLSIFLMFVAFSTIDMPSDFGGSRLRDIAADVTQEREGVVRAQAELEAARTDPSAPPELEERLAEEVRLAEARLRLAESLLAAEQARVRARNAGSAADPHDDNLNVGITVNGEPVPEGSTWQDELRDAIDRGEVEVNMGHPVLNERALRTLRNPDLALAQVQDAFSKFSFLLAPLSLPFIALMFLGRRGVTLYDHMTFALYGLAFAALLFSSVVLVAKIPLVGRFTDWLLIALPVHMYFQLKGAYALGWFSAFWRTIVLLIFALVVACIFFTLVVILGLAG